MCLKACLFVGGDSTSFRTLFTQKISKVMEYKLDGTSVKTFNYSRESNAVMQQQTFSIPHKLKNEEHALIRRFGTHRERANKSRNENIGPSPKARCIL